MCGGIRTSSSALRYTRNTCPGENLARSSARKLPRSRKENNMSSVFYIVGLVVVVIAVLSFFGLR